MSGWNTIRPNLLTLLQGVTDIGAVFDRPRWKADTMQLQSFRDSNNRLHFWWFQRTGVPIAITRTGGGYSYIHTVKVEGFMALNDANATETTFQELVDAVQNTFNAKSNIYSFGNGSVKLDSEEGVPAEVLLVEIGNFNDRFLAHHCEMEVRIREDITP